MTLSDIGEDALIRRLTQRLPLDPDPLAGPGDDCAVMDEDPASPTLRLLKTDALVEQVHFLPTSAARAVGWKAIARVVSDFAAMGGRPERFLITLALRPATPVAWVEELYDGMGDCLRAFGGVLAGGETSSVPAQSAAVIVIAATGTVKREDLTLRSTARAGHGILVTGTLGGAQHGRHLSFMPRLSEAAWLVANHKPSAMMDLSDGLAKDLPRLAAASGCGVLLDRDRLPLTPGCSVAQALGDGEDFELLFTCPAATVPALLAEWPAAFAKVPLTCIGRMAEPSAGETLTGGWDHFPSSP